MSAKDIIKHQWDPKTAPYAAWLKKLTPDEYHQHLAERRTRKDIKQAWKAVTEHNRNKWIQDLNNAMAKSMNNALITGDIDTIKKIAEMLGINTKEEIDVNLKSPLPFNDDFD